MPSVGEGQNDYLRSLLVVGVHDVRQEPTLAVTQLRLALELLDGTLVHHPRGVHDGAADRRRTRIYMADEHHVDVVARVFLSDNLLHCICGSLRVTLGDEDYRRSRLGLIRGLGVCLDGVRLFGDMLLFRSWA